MWDRAGCETPPAKQAAERLGEAVAALAKRLPKIATMLAQDEHDVLAF